MRCWVGVGAGVAVVALGACTPPPDPVLAAATMPDFELELADEACRMQAADQLLDVGDVVSARTTEDGAELILRVTRQGQTREVACVYTAETGDATIPNL